MPDREERFRLMFEVLAELVGDGPLNILDVGCGPGSLGIRLLERFPDARVKGVDGDPVLLKLGRAARCAEGRLEFVSADLRRANWSLALGSDADDVAGSVDAVLSTTALHWLPRNDLSRLYEDFARLLRPGGALIDGDHHFFPGQPKLERAAARLVVRARNPLDGAKGGGEDWDEWWEAVRADPTLEAEMAQRDELGYAKNHEKLDQVADPEHFQLLLGAGFSEAATVWQIGTDRILAAVR